MRPGGADRSIASRPTAIGSWATTPKARRCRRAGAAARQPGRPAGDDRRRGPRGPRDCDGAGRCGVTAITITSRNETAGQQLVESIQRQTSAHGNVRSAGGTVAIDPDTAVLVNATSLGSTKPDAKLPLDVESFGPKLVVAEVAYNTSRTWLTHQAAQNGLPHHRRPLDLRRTNGPRPAGVDRRNAGYGRDARGGGRVSGDLMQKIHHRGHREHGEDNMLTANDQCRIKRQKHCRSPFCMFSLTFSGSLLWFSPPCSLCLCGKLSGLQLESHGGGAFHHGHRNRRRQDVCRGAHCSRTA